MYYIHCLLAFALCIGYGFLTCSSALETTTIHFGDSNENSFPYIHNGSECVIESSWPKKLDCTFNITFSESYYIILGVGIEGDLTSDTFTIKIGILTAPIAELPQIPYTFEKLENFDFSAMNFNFPVGFPNTTTSAVVFKLTAEQLKSGFCLSNLSKSDSLIQKLAGIMTSGTNFIGGDICITFPNFSSSPTKLLFDLIIDLEILNKEKVNADFILRELPDIISSVTSKAVNYLVDKYKRLFPERFVNTPDSFSFIKFSCSSGYEYSINVGKLIRTVDSDVEFVTASGRFVISDVNESPSSVLETLPNILIISIMYAVLLII